MTLIPDMQPFIAEADALTGETVKIHLDKGSPITCVAIVGQLVTAREITESQNIRQIRTAPITLNRVSNPSLVAKLKSLKLSAIPNGWKCEVFGKAWPIANSMSDQLAFEFDIQQPIL